MSSQRFLLFAALIMAAPACLKTEGSVASILAQGSSLPANANAALTTTGDQTSSATGVAQTTTSRGTSTTVGSTTTSGSDTTGTGSTTTATGGSTTTATGGSTTSASPADANAAQAQRAGGTVTNPFAGALMYVNPDYTAAATASQARLAAGRSEISLIDSVKNQPTAIWLDRIAALAGGAQNSNRLGLTAHLAAAQAQGEAAGLPAVALFVVYDLPNRDCAALASNGELTGDAGLATYKAQYIDAIYSAVAQYPAVRVALIIEPDSLPNLVTNVAGVPACAAVDKAGYYVNGARYALGKLGSLPNTFMYIDMGHSGWLGWPNNMSSAVALIMKVVTGQAISTMSSPTTDANNLGLIRGFVTTVSNYTPVKEPFVSPTNQTLLSGSFYQFNPCFDETTYITALSAAFTSAGFASPSFIMDTSRSGWAKLNNGSPIDKRRARGNWCNVNGAGLGERPVANPAASSLLDAFVWVKPPGESDGATPPANFDPSNNAPDAAGKRYDQSCQPGFASPLNNGALTDAMSAAPEAGTWFDEQFYMLVRNATPAL